MLACLLEIWAILCGRHRWVAVQWGEGFAVMKTDRWGEEGVLVRKGDGEKGAEMLLNVCQKILKKMSFSAVFLRVLWDKATSRVASPVHHMSKMSYTLRPVREDWGICGNKEWCSLTGSHVFECLKRPNKEFRCLSACCFVVLSSRYSVSPVVTTAL